MNNTDMNLGDILEEALKEKERKFLEDLAQKGAPITKEEALKEAATETTTKAPEATVKVPAKPPSDNIYDDILQKTLETVTQKHIDTRKRLGKIIEDAKNIVELLHKQEDLAHEAIKETFINLGYVHSYADLLDTDLKKLKDDLTQHAPKKPSAATG